MADSEPDNSGNKAYRLAECVPDQAWLKSCGIEYEYMAGLDGYRRKGVFVGVGSRNEQREEKLGLYYYTPTPENEDLHLGFFKGRTYKEATKSLLEEVFRLNELTQEIDMSFITAL